MIEYIPTISSLASLLLSIQNNDSNKSYKIKETFVLRLLELKLNKEKKTLVKYVKEYYKDNLEKRFFEFDAIAPQGIGSLKGKTIIEIVNNLNNITVKRLSQLNNVSTPDYKSLLIIVTDSVGSNTILDIKDRLKNIIKLEVDIWDFEMLTETFNEFKNESENLILNIENETFSNIIERAQKSTDDWEEERDFKLNNLKRCYLKDDIVLMLGAGTSMDAGLLSWNGLLRELNLSIINEKLKLNLSSNEKEELVESLINIQAGAPLVSASYIKTALGENFISEIRNALYKSEKPIREQKLLEVISKMARPKRRKLGIDSIITYNFDDLLEKHLERQGVDFKSIFREGDLEEATSLPVFHVHGFIPKKQDGYAKLDKSMLVFSEDGYHQLQLDPYSWSNLVQMKALREKTCVLIGVSGIDPNLRRLFSIFSSKSDYSKHYIFLQRQYSKSIENKSKKFLEFSKVHHKISEDTFKELGLNTIWYNSHEEIPILLEKIYK